MKKAAYELLKSIQKVVMGGLVIVAFKVHHEVLAAVGLAFITLRIVQKVRRGELAQNEWVGHVGGVLFTAVLANWFEHLGTASECWTYHAVNVPVPYWVPVAWGIAYHRLYFTEKKISELIHFSSFGYRLLLITFLGAVLATVGEIVAIQGGVWTYAWEPQIFGMPLIAVPLLAAFHVMIFLILRSMQWALRQPRFPFPILAVAVLSSRSLLGLCLNDYADFEDKLVRTAGIEVEGTVPQDISNAALKQEIARVLREMPGVSNVQFAVKEWKLIAHISGGDPKVYEVTFDYEGKKHSIAFGRDLSINAPVGRRGVEFKSEILGSTGDRALFVAILDGLKKNIGLEGNPLNSGVHVHVGAEDLSANAIAEVVKAFGEIEADLVDEFHLNPGRELYTRPISDALRALVNRPDQDGVSIAHLIRAAHGRRHTLNLLSLNEFGTLEFRLFNSTVNGEQLVAISDFCVKFVDAVAAGNPKVLEIVNSKEGNKINSLMKELGVEMGQREREVFERVQEETVVALGREYPNMAPIERMQRAQIAAIAAATVIATGLTTYAFSRDDEGDRSIPKKIKK